MFETGTLNDGSALFMATVMDVMGRSRLITINKAPRPVARFHPRVSYLMASSVDDAIVTETRTAAGGKRTMVVLNSNHTAAHVPRDRVL